MQRLPAHARIPEYTDPRIIGLHEVEGEPLRGAIGYWQAVRGARRYPARADIRPKAIASILRHISLIKVDGEDFLYRIVGDVIVMAFDLPMQNRRLSELAMDEPGFDVLVKPILQRCVETGKPIAVRGKTGRDLARVNFTHYENVLLPFGPDDTAVDHIMAVSSYTSRPFG